MSDPSLLNIPYRFKASKLYSQIPDSGLGDFVVSRTTTPTADLATRVNASGFLELVPDNVPRLDYPLGGITAGCPSLLVEPSAQNLVSQSENLGTGWSLVNLLAFGSGSVLNTTATLDPYGTNVADLIVANATVGQHRVDRATVSASGSYTSSVFAKAAGYGFIRLRIGGDGAVFNLSNGSTSGIAAGIIASSQNYGNGWYRCIISKAAALANEDVRVNMQPTVSTADFGGDGTSGVYVFGAQYETGSAATSYIPTAASPVTRGADTISKTGISSLLGQTSGTFYLDIAYALRGTSTGNRWLEISSATNNIGLAVAVTDVVRSNVNAQSDILITPSTASGVKIAWGYDGSGVVLFVNGTQYTLTNGGAQVITSLDKILIDMSSTAGIRMAYARIRAISCYQTRLSNAQLQSLTQ